MCVCVFLCFCVFVCEFAGVFTDVLDAFTLRVSLEVLECVSIHLGVLPSMNEIRTAVHGGDGNKGQVGIKHYHTQNLGFIAGIPRWVHELRASIHLP